jgi:hypothetical protein
VHLRTEGRPYADMTTAVTTIAPTADQASASSPNGRAFDRAALAIFGAMVALIILLTAVLLETSNRTMTSAADDDAAVSASVVARTAPGR